RSAGSPSSPRLGAMAISATGPKELPHRTGADVRRQCRDRGDPARSIARGGISLPSALHRRKSIPGVGVGSQRACIGEKSGSKGHEVEEKTIMRKANGNLTRRDLLKRSAVAALAAPWFVPAAALGRDKKAAASERITLGVIGIGPRCTYD